MADTMDYDEFFNSLSQEDVLAFSSLTEIEYNYQVLNEIVDKLSDQNLNCVNPELLINKELKEELYYLPPADFEEKYDKKKKNLIKDILEYKNTYEKESKTTNKIIRSIKNSMKELTNSSNEIFEYSQKIYDEHDNDAKNLIKPMIKKEENLDKIDTNLLNSKDQSTFQSERENIKNKLKNFDDKAFLSLGKLRNILKNIFEKIKNYTDTMKSMSKPVNNIIETIIIKFNEFEEKAEKVTKLIESTKGESSSIIIIFDEMKNTNPFIINIINNAKINLENIKKDLMDKINECAQQNQNLTNVNNELSNVFQELTNEANKILSEIKKVKLKYKKSDTSSENVIIKGSDYSKFNGLIDNGTKILLRANEKIIADVSKLAQYFGEQQESLKNKTTLDLMFIMDVTGSMVPYLEEAKQKIEKIVSDLSSKCATIYLRIGFVGYRDYIERGVQYVDIEITDDIKSVRDKIQSVTAYGGRDCEDMPWGLTKTLNKNWKAKSKFAVLIADVPCHGVQYHGLTDGFDTLPGGDKKYDVIGLIKTFAEKNISLLCLNITERTIKLYQNFIEYYKMGKKNDSSSNIYIADFFDNPEKLSGVIVDAAEKVYEERHGIK